MENASMPEPTESEWQAAEAVLRQIPEYRWLTDSQTGFFKASQVASSLGVSEHIVRTWCERGLIRGAIKYDDAQVGWRIPRSGLLVYLARRVQGEVDEQQAI